MQASTDHLYAWKEASGTWFGPYATREMAADHRRDLPTHSPVRLVGVRDGEGGRVEFYELPKGRG